MIGRVFKINYSRSMLAFEVETDYGIDCGVLEILDCTDDFEIDDIIIGELDNTQVQTIEITNQRTGKRINVCIEDFGYTFSSAIDAIS